MNTDSPQAPENPIPIETLHKAHPRIRAQDWRSPLVSRLLGDAKYQDGVADLRSSFRPDGAAATIVNLRLSWAGLGEDYKLCVNTYQTSVLTEYAALAVACILCNSRAELEITEVTRRGEKVDYWLGDRELLLEVSGVQSGSLDGLCEEKSTKQLEMNPFNLDGYVCACRFDELDARLWFYAFPGSRS